MKVTPINNNNNNSNFKLRFIKNEAFMRVSQYASKQAERKEFFENALQSLGKAANGDVLIDFYKDVKGLEHSSFTLGKISVQNTPYDGENVLELTYRAIINLSSFGGRYKTLLGINGIRHRVEDVKCNKIC